MFPLNSNESRNEASCFVWSIVLASFPFSFEVTHKNSEPLFEKADKCATVIYNVGGVTRLFKSKSDANNPCVIVILPWYVTFIYLQEKSCWKILIHMKQSGLCLFYSRIVISMLYVVLCIESSVFWMPQSYVVHKHKLDQ